MKQINQIASGTKALIIISAFMLQSSCVVNLFLSGAKRNKVCLNFRCKGREATCEALASKRQEDYLSFF